MPKPSIRTRRSTVLFVATAALAACGGGDGDADSASAAPLPVAPAQVAISGRVADGPLAGAIVCYDLDGNGRCDAGEPASSPTDSEGRYSISVDPALAGKHRVVAEVPATAVDKDTGAAVGTAFTLVAPATATSGAQQVFVSPLTTLVQARIDLSGASRDAVVAEIQKDAALVFSPLGDFTDTPGDAARKAATVARLAQMTINRQTAALAGVVGQTDLSGAVVRSHDVYRAAVAALLRSLSAVSAAASAPAIAQAQTPAAREAALAQAAQTLLDDHVQLGADEAKLTIGVGRLPIDKGAEAQTGSASLTIFTYQSPDSWFYRALLANAADATPDASGRVRYYEQRVRRSSAGTVTWGYGSSPERAGDLHWNGTAWVGCPVGFRGDQSVSDANGRNEYNYCNGLEFGVRTFRTTVDVAGRSMRSVVELLRAVPGGSAGVAYSSWGPSDLGLLGDATMPAGARLFYQSQFVRSTAVAYDVRDSNQVVPYSAPVAAGGDARGANDPACRSVRDQAAATSLEDMAARYPGKPCIFGASAETGERNEWWSNSTVSLGTVANSSTPPAGTGSFYNTATSMRVGFVPGSTSVNYYGCLQRAHDSSSRNCNLIGTGSYRIETLGDARAMHFEGVPAVAQRTGFSRVFVERGGKVWYGYRNPSGSSYLSGRLDLTASNALFTHLGVPPLAP